MSTSLVTINRKLKKIEKRIETNVKKAWYENGLLLLEIQQKKLYKDKYSSFEGYLKERWDYSERNGYHLINAAKTYQILEKNLNHGSGFLPQNESQIRPLILLENDSQRVHVWDEIIESGVTPTRATVTEAVNEFKDHPIDVEIIEVEEVELVKEDHIHVSKNTGENEWYTPVKFIDSALKVMGTIDLDPASNEQANETVGANTIYTKETNGLDQEWRGNIWMNPPYDKQIKLFAQKTKNDRDDYSQMITLVNNATETGWFLDFATVASAVCFPTARIRFLDPKGNPGAPLQGQAIFYIGSNVEEFKEEFAQHGIICTF